MTFFYEDSTYEAFSSTNFTATENTPVTVLKISLLSFSFLFGFPTHCYVIWLIVRGTGSGVASFFILNLSICEIIFSLYSLIFVQRMMFPSLQNQVFLVILKFLMGDIFTIRPLFQCLICVECYLAVVRPVTFLKYKPLRYRVICCTVVWITGLGSCVLYTIVSYDAFVWISFVLFLIFLSIKLFCLVAVLRALKQSGPGERTREEENRMKRRAFHIILIMSMTTLIIFGPFIISRLFYIVTQGDTSVFNVFSLYCFVLGGFLPALLYLRRKGKLPFFKPP